MHDLNKTMFYKTAFDIRTTDEGDDALWSLLCSLRAWATRKYPALPREATFWGALKRTGHVPFRDDCPVRFRSELCLEDGGNHWALTIEEIAEMPGAAPRHWATEVSFAWSAADAGAVAIALSYGDTPGFLVPCQPEPALTLPGFIRTILENDRLVCTASGCPLSLGPTELSVGQFQELWHFIADGERETPLVYISPRFEPGSDEASFAVDLLEELHHENDQLKSRNDELESELYLAQAKATTLESQLNRTGRPTESSNDLSCWPLPYEDILQLFREHHGDRIDFTDRAYQSLGDCITEPSLVWNALHNLCAIAHPLFASRDAGDYARKINGQSAFELKRGAGKMTRKDSRLMAQYQDTYQGRAINAEAHLAKGNDDASPNSLRLYFAFDEETGRIVVSHVGKHLDNYSTRYLK